MIFRFLITIFSLVALCGCTNGSGNENTPPSGNISIAYLKSLCKGDHYNITSDYTISGVVVANDWLGECVKSIVVVDRSGGIEIAIDSSNIAVALPVFSEVEIFCNGLTLARVGGKIELGKPSKGEFPLANIEESKISHYISVLGVCEEFEPVRKRFSDISVADVSAVVRFDNIHICEEEQGLTWCDTIDEKPITTYRTFVDADGNRFAVRILSTCYYATDKVPTKEVSLTGVIDYSDNQYFLRIVNKAIRNS